MSWFLIIIMAGFVNVMGPFATKDHCEKVKTDLMSQPTWDPSAIATCEQMDISGR